MRKMFLIASAFALVVTTGVFMLKSTPTAATQMAPRASVLEMMASATDLPVAPTPDAF